jgi:hypothetical protein
MFGPGAYRPDPTEGMTTIADWKRNRKVAVHFCPSIPMDTGREERRGGTVGRLWSSRGAQQGVPRCTLAGPWLDSNLFVTLPEQILLTVALVEATRRNCVGGRQHHPRHAEAAHGRPGACTWQVGRMPSSDVRAVHPCLCSACCSVGISMECSPATTASQPIENRRWA